VLALEFRKYGESRPGGWLVWGKGSEPPNALRPRMQQRGKEDVRGQKKRLEKLTQMQKLRERITLSGTVANSPAAV